MNKSERPTALISYNDQLALMLLDVLRDLNIHVPNDLSIVGYDDSFLAQVSEVKLTTVKHPKHDMGQIAAKMIIKLIEEKNQLEPSREKEKVTSITFEPELIIRSSTKLLVTNAEGENEH